MPEFLDDWFTGRLPIWKQHVLPYLPENVTALEVGSHEGKSALWMAEHMLGETGTLVCVDPWEEDEIYHRFSKNTQGVEKLIVHRGYSSDLLPTFEKNSFDFIYIDGDHHGLAVMTDACLCLPLLKSGGIMVFDDYGIKNSSAPPSIAIDAFVQLAPVQIVESCYQMVLLKK